ncbi:HK97 family phage portal protein [Acetoanaerobium pronyense]|uniref:HK97 family phage portal protein n=1 Tax=Acetoanaerobium pronyense TaxID=1482736 RepID=A0ABS4KI07_9FIRM|nr:HK97 family phage portal protein [Acetoanaerobium pronyense]
MLFSKAYKNETVSLQDERLLDFLGISSNDVNVKGKNALKVATVFSCFRILTEGISKLPVKMYKNNKKDSSHYLYNILKIRPNPLMSAMDFWKTLEFQRNLNGNAYAYIDFDKKTGLIKALYPITSSKVKKILVDDTRITKKEMWYIIEDNGDTFKIPSDEMLHIKGLTDNGLVGISPIDYLVDLIENAKSGTDYINKFYKNGMQTKGIIHYVGDLNQRAEENFRNRFERMSSGLNNAHRVSLLPIGYQYQAISQKLAESQFFENNNLTIREIASAFGVKMHQINDLSRATFSNLEESMKEFYIETLQPVLTAYEQELMYKLLRTDEIEAGYYLKFNIDVILRSDLQKRFESYQKGIQNGIYTSNEVREKEELEPKEGGDRLLINGNMIPIDMAGSQYPKGGETENE